MSDNYIEFQNGSRIDIIEGTENSRSARGNQIKYYSDAFRKYRTIKGILEFCNYYEFKWYQKIMIILQCKWIDIKNHFINPYIRGLKRYIK